MQTLALTFIIDNYPSVAVAAIALIIFVIAVTYELKEGNKNEQI